MSGLEDDARWGQGLTIYVNKSIFISKVCGQQYSSCFLHNVRICNKSAQWRPMMINTKLIVMILCGIIILNIINYITYQLHWNVCNHVIKSILVIVTLNFSMKFNIISPESPYMRGCYRGSVSDFPWKNFKVFRLSVAVFSVLRVYTLLFSGFPQNLFPFSGFLSLFWCFSGFPPSYITPPLIWTVLHINRSLDQWYDNIMWIISVF